MDYVRNALPLIAVPVVLTIINLIFGFILKFEAITEMEKWKTEQNIIEV